jgi:signal transduction histidine kinase
MESLYKSVKNIFWKDISFGQDAYVDTESRRNHLVKILCYISLVSFILYATIYAIMDLFYLWLMILNLLVFCSGFIIGLLLLKRKKYMAARIIPLLSLTLPIFIGSGIFFGRSPGIHIFFFLFSLMPIVIWPFEKRGLIIFFFLMNIACFFYVEYIMPADHELIPFPSQHLVFIRSISYFISFLVIALVILLYQKLAEYKERLLLAANEDLKEKTGELSDLNNTKNRFFSILAHDLKSPFGAVLKGLELVIANWEQFSDKKIRKLMDTVHQSAATTYGLLEKLLEWGKITTHRLQPHFENIGMNEIITEAIDLYNGSILDKEIDVNLDLEKDLLVYADRNMLSVIVRNMISNAIKYTPRKGMIKILSES